MRLDIANKLEQGVCIDRILDDIRDSVDGDIDRQHLITQQDVHNIKYQYNIEGITRHQNDLTSVTAWVIEMQSLDYNPILLFKKQCDKQPYGMDSFADNDFLLCIQTQF